MPRKKKVQETELEPGWRDKCRECPNLFIPYKGNYKNGKAVPEEEQRWSCRLNQTAWNLGTEKDRGLLGRANPALCGNASRSYRE